MSSYPRAIVAVGYRVNSHRATEYRKWAPEVLHEFIIKGFTIDEERLKQIKHFGQDYFDEMLERIREIRLSERRFYQKITDIYELSADYDKMIMQLLPFFATVQNKLHRAIQGKTATEIIFLPFFIICLPIYAIGFIGKYISGLGGI